MPRVCVLHPHFDRMLWKEDRTVAERMVAEGLARPSGGAIRLTDTGTYHPCRTRISNGLGVRAACGMSQVYTTSNHGKVDGHKRIFAEDVRVFYTAVIECSV